MLSRVLTILILLFAASSPAGATLTQVIGGPGGSGFTIECPPGQAVIGVTAKAGAWVDGIAILCKAPVGNAQQVGWAGGTGGGPQEVYCSPGRYVRGIYMTFTRGNDLPREFVNSVGITCESPGILANAGSPETHCILSGDEYAGNAQTFCSLRKVSQGIWLPARVEADYLDCPGPEVLTGIHGRHGNYLDALGAICAPRPEAKILRLPINTAEEDEPSPASKVTPREHGALIEQAGGIRPALEITPTHIPPDPIKPAVITPVLIPRVLDNVGQCKTGYVWREASPDDQVCVTPESRERVRSENQVAASRVDPAGAYGPNSCKSGFVWREAFSGDLVCVTPEVRSLVREENAQAADRRL